MKKNTLIVISILFFLNTYAQRSNSSELFLKMWDNSRISVKFGNDMYPKRTDLFSLVDIRPGYYNLTVYKKQRRNNGQRHRKRIVIFNGQIGIPTLSRVFAKINSWGELVITRTDDIQETPEPPTNTLPELNLPSVKAAMAKTSFSSDKIRIAKQAISTHEVWTNQIRSLMDEFSFDSDRLKLAKFAYGYCSDPEKYYTINSAFKFSSSIEKLDEYIKHYKP